MRRLHMPEACALWPAGSLAGRHFPVILPRDFAQAGQASSAASQDPRKGGKELRRSLRAPAGEIGPLPVGNERLRGGSELRDGGRLAAVIEVALLAMEVGVTKRKAREGRRGLRGAVAPERPRGPSTQSVSSAGSRWTLAPSIPVLALGQAPGLVFAQQAITTNPSLRFAPQTWAPALFFGAALASTLIIGTLRRS